WAVLARPCRPLTTRVDAALGVPARAAWLERTDAGEAFDAAAVEAPGAATVAAPEATPLSTAAAARPLAAVAAPARPLPNHEATRSGKPVKNAHTASERRPA